MEHMIIDSKLVVVMNKRLLQCEDKRWEAEAIQVCALQGGLLQQQKKKKLSLWKIHDVSFAIGNNNIFEQVEMGKRDKRTQSCNNPNKRNGRKLSVEEGNSTEVMGEPKSTRFVMIIFSHYDLS